MNRRLPAIALWSGFVLMLMAGCAVGPNYQPPAQAAMVAHNLDAAHFSATAPASNWWTQFQDPELSSLERRALQADPDVHTAIARVSAARASFHEAALDFAPHLPINASYSQSKEQYPGLSTERIDIRSYAAGFDASWELDLFGHTRREAQAASAQLQFQQATLQDTQVTVAAEVARNYFELRGVQHELAVTRENLDNEREALHLTQIRYDAGRVTELDVDSAQARLKATEAELPQREAQQKAYGYRLAVLLGVRPGDLDSELERQTPSPARDTPLPIGDVSNLLRHRPDVRAAERALAASSAQVGVATAELFPRVTFDGVIGFLTGDASQFGKAASRAWSYTPTVSWTGLDFPTAQARLRAAKADSEVALAAYQKAVLTALEDFENACVSYRTQQTRLASVLEQEQASRRAADLAQIQYREGRINFLVLLDAQRTLLQADEDVAAAQTAVNTSAVAVYKALGGIGT
ncbi:MAG TPA: efflux transporter outer membrane subunit [Steroidobacteraceae bacterium]|nr:efflux transporter outer membrane subunit [Steroidobacteraceae bacterium]